MWMTQYITEIQRQLVEAYGFPKGENGCPQNVPDGAYPMLIEKKLDLVVILNGTIWCCNSITEKGGLKKFQAEARAKYCSKACALIDCWGPAYRGFNPKKISKTNDGQ